MTQKLEKIQITQVFERDRVVKELLNCPDFSKCGVEVKKIV